MNGADIRAGKLVYTAKDVEVYLSHLAHWYETERSGDKDVLRRPAEMEDSLFRLSASRRSMRLDPESAPEFTRYEALAMIERLSRKRFRARGHDFVIRPQRLIAAMRGLRTRQDRQT